MKRLYYIILTALCIAALSCVLPWLCSLCIPDKTADPFVSWSPVSDRFIVSMPVEEGKSEPDIFELDPATGEPGRHFTTEQRDSLLPEMYINQLAARDMVPDSIKGIEMSMPNVRRNRWVFSSLPHDINRSKPQVYPLMESMPARFELEDPAVAMTFTDNGVNVTDIESNRPDSLKTARFSLMMADRGFVFPPREATANITTRKAYDNGYLIIDNDNNLFHLKMQVGRPSMARIGMPAGAVPEHVWVTENVDRAHYGLVSTSDGALYVIERENYRPVKLPGVTFDPSRQRLVLIKSLFSWVLRINDSDSMEWIALDARDNYNCLGRYTYMGAQDGSADIEKWIFPFTLSFTSRSDLYVSPRIGNISWHALALNLLLAIALTVARRRSPASRRASGFAVTLVFGIFAFIPLLLIKH